MLYELVLENNGNLHALQVSGYKSCGVLPAFERLW